MSILYTGRTSEQEAGYSRRTLVALRTKGPLVLIATLPTVYELPIDHASSPHEEARHHRPQ